PFGKSVGLSRFVEETISFDVCSRTMSNPYVPYHYWHGRPLMPARSKPFTGAENHGRQFPEAAGPGMRAEQQNHYRGRRAVQCDAARHEPAHIATGRRCRILFIETRARPARTDPRRKPVLVRSQDRARIDAKA